jgi:competence protein ComEC
MFPIAIAFCAGAAIVHALPALLPVALLAVPACIACMAFRRRPVLAALLAGFAWTHLLAFDRLEDGWPCSRDREERQLTGRIAAPAFVRAGRTDFDLDVEPLHAADTLPSRARISWYEADAVPRPGERWRLTARLRCRNGFANPGAADRELGLLRQRIDATGYVAGDERPLRLADAPTRPLERLRGRIADAIAASAGGGPSVAVLQGLAVGVRGNVPDALWETFAVTGVAHLMAISGLHVTGCALAVLAVLRLACRLPMLARLRARLAWEAVLVVAATAGYTVLAGASLPALRTLASVALVALLRLMRRALALHEMLAAAALLLVATDPLAIASGGFWLSFVATAALLAVVSHGQGLRARIAAFARAQLAITALLAPVLVATFGRLSLVAPAVNAAAIPLFTALLLPAVLSATLLEAAIPGAASGAWRLLAAALDSAWPPLEAIAAWRDASWAPAAQPAWLLLAAGIAALAALVVPLGGLRLAAAAIMLALACGGAARPPAGGWTLTVLDVGQGLAAVVETARHTLVFDAGPQWRGGGTAARVSLLPFLGARGIRVIDVLVASHDDMDHAGGVASVQQSIRVHRLLAQPGSAIESDGPCRLGEAWRWDGVEFRFLHPPPGLRADDNGRSCALAIRGTGGSALLVADVGAKAEAVMLSQRLAADVVLLPHHGSRSSSTPPFIEATGARLGVASAGFGNRWGMPVAEVVARWRARGTTVLETPRDGAVTIRYSAERRAPDVETERGDRRRWWRRAPSA